MPSMEVLLFYYYFVDDLSVYVLGVMLIDFEVGLFSSSFELFLVFCFYYSWVFVCYSLIVDWLLLFPWIFDAGGSLDFLLDSISKYGLFSSLAFSSRAFQSRRLFSCFFWWDCASLGGYFFLSMELMNVIY